MPMNYLESRVLVQSARGNIDDVENTILQLTTALEAALDVISRVGEHLSDSAPDNWDEDNCLDIEDTLASFGLDVRARAEDLEVIVFEVGRVPCRQTVGNDLESLQALVGGDLQAVSLRHRGQGFNVWVHEEGKMMGLPANAQLVTPEGLVYDVIVGTFFVTGPDVDGEATSVTPEIVDAVADYFRTRCP